MIKNIHDKPSKKPEIDLTGPEGNAFILLGYARQWAKDLDKDSEKITKDMVSGNYNHLVEVLEREFGEYITLYR